MPSFDLKSHGITVESIGRNLNPSQLYEEAAPYRAGHVHCRFGGIGCL